MVSGKKKVISNHPPQECVEAYKKMTNIQTNHDPYHKNGVVTDSCITGMTRIITWIRS